MKYRCSRFDDSARKLMGMSGVKVYECYTEHDHYFDVVWRDKSQWHIPYPWEANKRILERVGRSVRYRADEEERLEKTLTATQRLEEEQRRDDDSDSEVMVRDVMRTVDKKPLYFY